MSEVPFVVLVDAPRGTKGLTFSAGEHVLKRVTVPVETLRENLTTACTAIAAALQDVRRVGSFRLTSVELGVEVTAEGGVSFVGSSKVGASGSITLKFEEGAEVRDDL